MSDRSVRLQALKHALKERILILDGGMGTMIQSYKLEEQDYRGKRFADWPSDVKGNNDLLVLTRPDVIGAIEKAYLDAGADILETNTFNATQVSLADYGMQGLAYELNVEGARLARKIADAKTLETPEKPRFVAGVIGPTSRTCSLSPDVNNPGYPYFLIPIFAPIVGACLGAALYRGMIARHLPSAQPALQEEPATAAKKVQAS